MRRTLGYAEEAIMRILHDAPGPMDRDEIAKARNLRTTNGTYTQLRNLDLRGLVTVVVPARDGKHGHKARYLPVDRVEAWRRAQEAA